MRRLLHLDADQPLRDLLLDSVRSGASPAGLPQVTDDETGRRLLELAELHGVVPLVRRRLPPMGGPTMLDEGLDPTAALATATHLRALGDLSAIGDALRDARVPWIIMKGPAASELLWDKPEHREYTDLDVLVAPPSFASALDGLMSAGFVLLEQNWDLLLERRRGQVHLGAPHGTLVDLHWDLIGEGPLRDLFDLDTNVLMRRSVKATIGSTEVRVLDPTDQLLHLALHGCQSGAHRLVWFKDVEAACTASAIDWDLVVERARHARIGPLVGLMLRRTNEVLDIDLVPPNVIRDLESNLTWRWATRIADAASSPVPLQDGSLRKLVARSTRPTSRQSWAALLRSSSSWASVRSGRSESGDLSDPTHRGSMLFESGGDAGRRAYIDWVTTTDHSSPR